MNNDTELAISLLPRLHKAGIATDLCYMPNHEHFRLRFEHDPPSIPGAAKAATWFRITDAQAIAYIIGCIHEQLWYVTRGMPAREMSVPARMDYHNSPLSSSAILAEHYSLIPKETA